MGDSAFKNLTLAMNQFTSRQHYYKGATDAFAENIPLMATGPDRAPSEGQSFSGQLHGDIHAQACTIPFAITFSKTSHH